MKTIRGITITIRLGRLASVVVALALVGAACSRDYAEKTPTTVADAVPTTAAEEAPSVETLRDIPYSDDNPRQVLDVYLPTTVQGPFPTILGIHGGGFATGSKSLYEKLGPYYADKGYAFVAMNYRLVPDHTYPAQVEDSFCALAWVHNNAAEYRFDPSQVVVTGGSSGGYQASMVGTVDDPTIYLENCPHQYPSTDPIQGAVIYYSRYDFTNVDDESPGAVRYRLPRFWGAAYEDIPAERLAEMSPISHVDGSEPAFIILHGTADTVVPSVMSERFAAALEQAGVDVELVLLPDVDHAFELKPLTGEEMTLALSEIDDFLERTLDS